MDGPTLKHKRVVAVLGKEIRNGGLERGAQLPGEVSLAKRFSVSRTTIRSALAELNSEGLITTHSGKGSFVLYDGRPLRSPLGWASAFAEHGVETTARVVRIARDTNPALAETLSLPEPLFVLVERIRELSSGEAISRECSWIPAIGELRDLPRNGIGNRSLTQVLAGASLFADHGQQQLGARALTEAEAHQLGRAEGTWFLQMTRTSWSATDAFVEHVDSLLDPAHFQISHEFSADQL